MNIPTGYRRLVEGEAIIASDEYQWGDNRHSNVPSTYVGKRIGDLGYEAGNGISWQILRKLEEKSQWINVKDRLPEKSGWCFAKCAGLLGIMAHWNGLKWDNTAAPFGMSTGKIEYWMPIPEVPKPVDAPIVLNESGTKRVVKFDKDGSVQVGCVKVDSSTFEAISARRKKTMA